MGPSAGPKQLYPGYICAAGVSCQLFQNVLVWSEATEACAGDGLLLSDWPLRLYLFVQGLLKHVLDHNKHVQEAACSALATLVEQSIPEQLVPRLKVSSMVALGFRVWGTL